MAHVERKADWQEAISNPHLVLKADSSASMKMNWRLALLFIFVGTLIARNPQGDGRPEVTIVLGGVMAAIGIWFLIAPFVQKGHTAITIDENGLLLHLSKSLPPALVPWSEVQGVERTSYARPFGKWIAVVTNEPCLVVSKAFYDRALHVDSIWKRGPAWHLTFVQEQSRQIVRIVLVHGWFGWPKRSLFEALAVRWQRFGPVTPEALAALERHRKAGAMDQLEDGRAGLLSRPGVRFLAVGLGAVALVWLWLKADDFLAPKYTFYFEPRHALHHADRLLEEGTLPARRSDGRMTMLSAKEVTGMAPIDCTKERVPNPDAFDRATRTIQRVTCTMTLDMADGTKAIGLMRVQHQITLETTFGATYSYVAAREVPVSVALPEAETIICGANVCK